VATAHRDRVLQADRLIDQAAATIGPEPGTTYNVYWHLDGVLVQTPMAGAGAGASQAYANGSRPGSD